MTVWIHIFVVSCLLAFPLSPFAQGYSIDIGGERIVVEGEEQWREWSYPKGTLDISEDGGVHPVYIRKNINACLNARDFTYGDGIQGGILDVGSNADDADNVIDGDPTTYWEPDREDQMEDRWVRVDLGRLVLIKKIVVRFAEGKYSDPFLGFKVRVSPGVYLKGELHWDTTWSAINTDPSQRVFEFEPEPSPLEGCPYGRRSEIQYVEVRATATQGDKAEEISKQEYESLDLDLRGAAMYYRIIPTGEEEWLDKEGYENLPPEQKGTVRYYRREVPRLVEIEVWSAEGENLCVGAVARGGSTDQPVMIDGVFGTFGPPSMLRWSLEAQVEIDLGVFFWMDTIQFVTPGEGSDKILHASPCFSAGGGGAGYKEIGIHGSDGTRATDGSLVWETLTLNAQGRYKARYIRVDFVKPGLTYEWIKVSEIQLYGEGYVPGVEMTSPIIETGEHRSLASLRWDAEIPPETKVEIRTRTGNTLKEEIRYFDAGGREITSHEYHKLPFFKRGEKVAKMVPADDWSMWSYPYAYPEDRISSPNPRKYLQVQARLLSEDPEVCATLRSLQIQFFSPLVQQIVGEVYPTRAEREGQLQDFSFYLRPSFISGNTGFDEILFYSPSHVDIDFHALHIGTEEEYADEREEMLTSEDLEIRSAGSDSVWVHLPYVVQPGADVLIRIDFSSVIYLNGTVFEASVVHSSAPDSPQRVDAGDATELVRSEEMTVFVPVEERVIGDVEIAPDPFTPNGDGINDEVYIGFSVFKVYVSVPVWVEIGDLNGRRIRRIERQRETSSGRYSIEWDGRDEESGRVRPGVYVVRIGVEDEVVMRTVRVVY